MSETSLSHYAVNQILNATANSNALASDFFADALPRATNATVGISDFDPAILRLTNTCTAWTAGMINIANAEAVQKGATQLYDAHITSLTTPPDTETNSLIEQWTAIIRTVVPLNSATYVVLLPHGRETITSGTIEQQLEALDGFASRLGKQTTKPALLALGTTVTTYAATARSLRTAQLNAKDALDSCNDTQKPLRIAAANAMYAVLGQGMVTWFEDPARVDTLWDVNILRRPALDNPAAPTDTNWDPANRTLSTTALPDGATRVEAYRVAPGGTPELLGTSARGESSVVIPDTITFTPGVTYKLWLVGLNSKGPSTPGPIQNWTP